MGENIKGEAIVFKESKVFDSGIIGFVLGSRAGPAGGTRDYASSCVYGEGTFCSRRVSMNSDRWERVKLSHISPLNHFSRAVLNFPASGR